MLLQQAPQGGGSGAKLALDLRLGPRLGEQAVLQVGPHAGEAEFCDAGSDALHRLDRRPQLD